MRHCANVADQFAQMLTQASASRRVKDPDAPKRAASSYIFFQNDLRQELRKQHPDIAPAEIMARVSKQWAEMTPEQKGPYERLQAEAKQRWETEKRAYDERRGIVAPTKPASRKAVTTAVEEPVQLTESAKLPQKTPGSRDSSTDTSLSDKSSGEEDEAGGNSGEEENEEMEEEVTAPPPPPPPTKSKAKRKGETATASTAKPKSKASLSSGPTPARPEKKKRSKP